MPGQAQEGDFWSNVFFLNQTSILILYVLYYDLFQKILLDFSTMPPKLSHLFSTKFGSLSRWVKEITQTFHLSQRKNKISKLILKTSNLASTKLNKN